ncbi:MAG: FkbM family methyltransferase [Bacteroidota bacterium]
MIKKIVKVIKWVKFRYRKIRFQLRKKPIINVDKVVPLLSLGTQYGGWKVPEGFLNEQSVCYFAGAGIDISFDVEVATLFKTNVHIIDPTPVAKNHFETLVEKTRKGEKLEIDRKRDLHYKLDPDTLNLLHYLDVGLWSEDTTIKFYEPGNNKTMVSHSIVNLHRTDSYFEAEVVKVSTLMKRLGHTHIDYLKIDIEGAEYEVISSVIKDRLDIGVLGIEFDEVHHPLDRKSIERIEQTIKKIKDVGYLVVDVDSHYNVTFLKKQIYSELYSTGKE